MQTIQIPLSEDVYRALDRLARENETDPATLIRVQVERLAAMYTGEGLTPDLREHLAASIGKHRKLLQRLAE
ncbi:MAG: hypothetical protein ACE5HA_19695 [Anaerolineae bacterium]